MKTITLFILSLLFVVSANSAIFRVSSSGDSSDGATWATAYQTVKAALDVAVVGDEIWVAQGSYVIDAPENQLSFVSGVNVYGGFVGTESVRTERSSDASLTIISHQEVVADNFRLLVSVDLDDPTLWDGFTFDGNNAGSGIHLSGNCTLNNAVVQNGVITNGSGAGVYMSSGSGFIPVTLSNAHVLNNTLKVSSDNTNTLGGAGVNINTGAKLAEINNCTISNNTIEGISASGNLEAMGAGIRLYSGKVIDCVLDNNHLINSENSTYQSNVFTGAAITITPEKVDVEANEVLIEGCTITNNTSPSRGGAIVIDPRWSGEYHGNYTISKTIITNNAGRLGGGIFTTAATRQVGSGWTLNIENTLLSNNSSTHGPGGAININASQVLNITNTTIGANLAASFGGGGIFLQGPGNQTINATFKNLLAWGNVATGRSINEQQLRINEQVATVIFSAVQDWDETYWELGASTLGDNLTLSATNDDAAGPGFVAPASTAGYDVADALTADWRLTETSACVDMGDDYLTEDLVGTARPTGDWSDIGAYEYFVDQTTSISDVVAVSEFDVYSSGNSIVVLAELDGVVNIYNITGSLIKSVQVAKGANRVALSPNQIYLVRFNNMTRKVYLK